MPHEGEPFAVTIDCLTTAVEVRRRSNTLPVHNASWLIFGHSDHILGRTVIIGRWNTGESRYSC